MKAIRFKCDGRDFLEKHFTNVQDRKRFKFIAHLKPYRDYANIFPLSRVDHYLKDYKLAIDFINLPYLLRHLKDKIEARKNFFLLLAQRQEMLEKKQGVKYIPIFEFEWFNYQDQIKNFILRYCKQYQSFKVINQSDCEFGPLTNIKKYVNINCINHNTFGWPQADKSTALYYDEEPVTSLIIDDLCYVNVKYHWHIFYLEHKLGYQVNGGFKALFQEFLYNNDVRDVILYSDPKWTNESELEECGFKSLGYGKYDRVYYHPETKNLVRRNTNLKQIKETLNLSDYDDSLPEWRNCLNNNWAPLYFFKKAFYFKND